MSNYDPEDVAEEPDGTGENPHPMGPHGNSDERIEAQQLHEVVLFEGEVMDDA